MLTAVLSASLFMLGVCAGLSVGLIARRTLRQERNEARALVVMFNNSAQADDLAEVGPITPPRGTCDLFDQDSEGWGDALPCR